MFGTVAPILHMVHVHAHRVGHNWNTASARTARTQRFEKELGPTLARVLIFVIPLLTHSEPCLDRNDLPAAAAIISVYVNIRSLAVSL